MKYLRSATIFNTTPSTLSILCQKILEFLSFQSWYTVAAREFLQTDCIRPLPFLCWLNQSNSCNMVAEVLNMVEIVQEALRLAKNVAIQLIHYREPKAAREREKEIDKNLHVADLLNILFHHQLPCSIINEGEKRMPWLITQKRMKRSFQREMVYFPVIKMGRTKTRPMQHAPSIWSQNCAEGAR